MASTIAFAREKYQRAQASMVPNYNQGMAAFLGISSAQVSGSPAGQKYAAKISDPNAAAKWEANLRRAFGA